MQCKRCTTAPTGSGRRCRPLLNATLTPETCAALKDERAWDLKLPLIPKVGTALGTLSAHDLDLVRAILVEAEPVDEAMLARVPPRGHRLPSFRARNVDLEAARGQDVAVIHAPGRNAEAVSRPHARPVPGGAASYRHRPSRHRPAGTDHRHGHPGVNRAAGDVIWRPDDAALPVPYVPIGPSALRLHCGRGWFRRGPGGPRVAGDLMACKPGVVVDRWAGCDDIRARALSLSPRARLARADIVTLHARSASPVIGRAELARSEAGKLPDQHGVRYSVIATTHWPRRWCQAIWVVPPSTFSRRNRC